MGKVEFIQTLRSRLQGLSQDEINDVIYDYEEHFQIGISKGKTEEQISRELGDPKVLAKMYKTSVKINQAQTKPSPRNLFKAVFATMGLGIFNLVVVLVPLILAICVLLGLYVFSIGIIYLGIHILFYGVFKFRVHIYISLNPVSSISFGIGIISVGILVFIMSIYLSKLLYKGIIKYLKWNVNIIKGKN